MKSVSFQGIPESRHSYKGFSLENNSYSYQNPPTSAFLNYSASATEKGVYSNLPANMPKGSSKAAPNTNSLISKMAKLASGKKLTEWSRKPEGNEKRRDISNKRNPSEYKDLTEYGTPKPYLQLKELKNESHGSVNMLQNVLQGRSTPGLNHSFNGQIEQPSFTQDEVLKPRNENSFALKEDIKGNSDNARSRSLPPLDNKPQVARKQQSNVLSELNVLQNERIVYNPRSKNPYKVIRGQGTETGRKSNSIAPESQVAKYMKDSISPLLDIKQSFLDPRLNRENKMKAYLERLDEEKKKRGKAGVKNTEGLFEDLSFIKPAFTYDQTLKKIPRKDFEEQELPPLPNASVIEHLSQQEKRIVQNLANQASKQKKLFDNGIMTKEELTIAKLQSRADMVEGNDMVYGPFLKDIGRQGIASSDDVSVKEATAFWNKNIGKALEVRWDLFEECIRVYIETSISEAEHYLRQFNLIDFFAYIRAKLSHYDIVPLTGEDRIKETIESPLCKGGMEYMGPTVTLNTLLQFTRTYGLKYMFTYLFNEFFVLLKKQGYQLEDILEKKSHEWAGTSVHTDKHYGSYQYGCGGWYKGEWQKGKRHGKGKLVLVTGDQYEGDFQHGKRHGFGTQTLSRPIKGVTYKGEWKDDLRDGYGAVEWPDGTFFQGRWEKGVQTFGTFIWPFQGEYTGHWLGPEMDGEGTFKSKDGDVYSGYWKNSVMHGEGERETAEGELYSGLWTNGQLNGLGLIVTQIGKYEGEISNSVENGQGVMKWNDTSAYSGTWKDGLPHGKGKFVSSNGEIYEGEFIDGRKEGRGKKFFSNGDVYEGDWLDEKMTGEGTMVYRSIEIIGGGAYPKYVGYWKESMRHGYGVMEYEDQSVYEGFWVNGKRQGKGKLVMVFPDEKGIKKEMVYEGDFQNDTMHGYGVMIWPNGDTYKGEWAGSKRHGRGEMKIGKGEWIQGLFGNDALIDANVNRIGKKSKEDVEALNKRLREDMILDLTPEHLDQDQGHF